MKLFEMEGFLRGKCLPGDMKVNETNAEYMVRKFTELEQKLAESQREFRVADATIENLQMQVEKLAAENAGLKALARGWANATDDRLFEEHGEIFHDSIDACEEELKAVCPTTDAFLAEVRAHDLNAFIRHHSAELDAHIKNGGEQFDEKSVRIRDIIVSARLFREQIRKEAAQ